MNKQVFLCLCCTFLALTTVSAKEYHTGHFIINSDLQPAYVQLIQANAEAYYANTLISLAHVHGHDGLSARGGRARHRR